ncbi:MAG: hypothetical protein CR965_01615 [Paludibacter sp.]|nr:MAG: hypothetical protein CR965_01615 [Paludibacter sp.]
MTAKRKGTELEYLKNYRLLFDNLSKVADIQAEMAEYGYDQTAIDEGKALYEKAELLYNERKVESAEEKKAYDTFAIKLEELKEFYKKDRKKAKVALLKNTELYQYFQLNKQLPQAYLKLMQEAKFFYEQIQTNLEAKPLLARLKLTEEVATSRLELVNTTFTLRVEYEKEKGESQQATKDKNKAFEDIAEWIRDFYAVAEIALEDHPQLMESIGKFVRS